MPLQKAFGSKTTADSGSLFIQLKSKGEKVQFRFVLPPYYDGKHFLKDEQDKWKVIDCPKIMSEEHCDYCDNFFKLYSEAKQIKDKNEQEKKLKEARFYKNKVTFYYPILDREDGKGKILKTTLSVRLKVDDLTAMGLDVTKNDYVLMRTEKVGNDYYTLQSIDSSVSKELSKEDKKEIEEIKKWDIPEKVGIKVKESSETFVKESEIKNDEKVNPDDIPF